jgi:hypothetical protein
MAVKLTKAQTELLKSLYEDWTRFKTGAHKDEVRASTVAVLERLGYAEWRTAKGFPMWFITESGEQLARELFGSNEPDPDASEPAHDGFCDWVELGIIEADDDDSELDLSDDAMDVVELNPPAPNTASEVEILADLAIKKLNSAQESTLEYLYTNKQSPEFGSFKTRTEQDYKAINHLVRKVKGDGTFGTHKYILNEQGRIVALKLFFFPFSVYNMVIDTDPFEFDNESEVIAFLQDCKADGVNLYGYLVQQYSAPHVVIESLNAATWLSEHAQDTASAPATAEIAKGDTVEITESIQKRFPSIPVGMRGKVRHISTYNDGFKEYIVQLEDGTTEYINQGECVGVPKPAIQWRKVADLPAPAVKYWNQLTGYVWLQDRTETPSVAPRRDLGQKVVQLPNMQRRSAQTPITRKQTPMPRETVMQIVSRVRTPLAGQVRRIA